MRQHEKQLSRKGAKQRNTSRTKLKDIIKNREIKILKIERYHICKLYKEQNRELKLKQKNSTQKKQYQFFKACESRYMKRQEVNRYMKLQKATATETYKQTQIP